MEKQQGANKIFKTHWAYHSGDAVAMVSKVFENTKLVVSCGNNVIATKDKPIMLPAEMETLVLDKSKVYGDITISVKEGK